MTTHNTVAVCEVAIARIPAGDAAGGTTLLANPLRHYLGDPNLLYVAGNSSLALANHAAALDYYERSVAVAPTFVTALANLGFLLRLDKA